MVEQVERVIGSNQLNLAEIEKAKDVLKVKIWSIHGI